MGAVDPRIDERVEFEFDTQFLLRKLLHAQDFMLVDAGAYSFQLQWQIAVQQESDSPHAALIAARYLCKRFVGFPGPPVKRDFNSKRRVLAQIISDLFVDEDPIGEQRNQKPFLLCEGIDLEEIFAGKNFAACKQQPNHAHIGQFAENREVFFFR